MTIRKNTKMTDQVEVLNNHSDAVGEAVYNIGDYQSRAQFVNAVAAAEGSSQLPAASIEHEARRQEREKEDESFAQKRADIILKRDKKRRNEALSSQTRVKPLHREFLQRLITENKDLEIHNKTQKKFPGHLR